MKINEYIVLIRTGTRILQCGFRENGAVFSEMHVFRLQQEEGANRENIHLGPQKAVDGLSGRADNGLILIEGCVQQKWYPDAVAKATD